MNKIVVLISVFMTFSTVKAQNVITPEKLLSAGRLSAVGISKDSKKIVYKVSTPSMTENKMEAKYYSIPVNGGTAVEVADYKSLLSDRMISSNKEYILYSESVKVQDITAQDYYPELEKATVQIYNGLDYRHWDAWNEGKFNHVFYRENKEGAEGIDIMKGEKFSSPQMPFGGDEDFTWSPDGKSIFYVSKKLEGTKYATSTNTDIYEYNLATKKTVNRTESNKGYDTNPAFSPAGNLTWLQMKRDGYEADKNDIVVDVHGQHINLTAGWDGTVNSFLWSDDGKKIYFTAPVDGTIQLFEVNFPGVTKIAVHVKQVTNGNFDITGIVGILKSKIFVTRTDMNSPADIFSFDLKSKKWDQLTSVNESLFKDVASSKTEKRYVTTTDGKKMLVWVIYPPNFDATKKYPTLLYCQGGPQSALTQFYSFRWNFQLMAANGYIVVAPNRRGMPGHGVEWNEAISKDWGGQVMDDYLSAIDDVAKESYVDNARIGAVGASYGGYSVFYLAGHHNKRFKSFIAHDGVFNLQSMQGTTEEVFFTNWDLGGQYWDKNNKVAQKSYADFNPINFVDKWDTPILVIQGGMDFRVPIGQGQEAFQAAQLRGIKSRFLYFPDENHWVLKPQNALVWQREFFKWLKETL